MIKKFLDKKSDYFYFVFRVIIGLLFLLHGIQKTPGIMNGSTSLFSLIGIAALIEVVGGIMIIVGLLTRYVALVAAVEMLVAYFKVHFPGGINPLVNKGEAALLFFVAFLVIMAFGPKKFALDYLIKKQSK